MTGATTAISHGITTIACRQMDKCGHSSKTSWPKRLRAAKHREGDIFLNIIIGFNLGILERQQQDGWTSGQSSDEDIAGLHYGPTVPTEPSNNPSLDTHTHYTTTLLFISAHLLSAFGCLSILSVKLHQLHSIKVAHVFEVCVYSPKT